MVTLLPSERIEKLRKNERYLALLTRLEEEEKDRKFCRHNLAHFLDVARIMSILNVEFHANCAADEIYAAALLHDIGRAQGGGNHALVSAHIAREILPQCGFDEGETRRICAAILSHSSKGRTAQISSLTGISEEEIERELAAENPLGVLLARADKLSRNCFSCPARGECYWEKKTERIWI